VRLTSNRFQFTNHCQEVLDSCRYNEPRAASILRSDRDEWAVFSFSGDLKYSSSADTLELKRCAPLW
jgi:hypothetical protein